MKQAYTPTLQVLAETRVRKLRELPLPGECLVEVGAEVEASTPVLAADLPGDLTIVRVADRMGFDPSDVVDRMKMTVGDAVEEGQLLCQVKTFFNLFTTELKSPATGVIEFFTEANAHLGIRHPPIPLSVNAYIAGRVVELEESKSVTIETQGALIQGIFGVGGERHGEILSLPFAHDEVVTEGHLDSLEHSLVDKVLVGGAQFTIEALRRAAGEGVSAVVTGSIDAKTLADFVGFEIGVSITGDEDVPFTLIITEGFGELGISTRVMELARELDGRFASVNGATQVRAGATRPEIIVPLSELGDSRSVPAEGEAKSLELGARVRVIRVPHFGHFGTIIELPQTPREIPSGAAVRVLVARLENGEEVIIPRANVELV